MKTSYPQELIDLAKDNGYKAANLQFLDQILLEFNELQDDGIEIEVPKYISISNQNIISHLNEYAPLWQDKWKEFTEAQGSSAENLTPLAIDKLHEIQELIQVAFNDKSHKFVVEGMEEDKKQMVRSTGDEDRVDVANPGGNESVPSDGDKISSSIGAVISSYFSEKSMSQRLKSGEEITKTPPLMPCLIQELVGETSKDNLPPVSGIIYTDSKNVRVQAAYGHGELVVNSKGNFDNFFVTNEDVVHQYIGDKKVRIVPVVNQAERKMELEEIENSELAHNPSLSEEQSIRLAKFSKFVQSKYGMRMDIEFVYDPNSNKINIVQARPIPEGKRRGMAPSALSNDFISQEKPQYIDGEVITPDVMVAKKITNKKEVIVCKSIDQALSSYLKNKSNNIRAVIIDKTAPDTSHEAGFFTSQAIPVIYANDYDEVEKWVQNLERNVLVIDPQHGSIYQIDKDQYQDGLIEEGIFRSSLAEHVTPIKREFVQGPSNESPKVQAQTIGELVIEARNNPDATQKLFRYIHDEIGPRETKLYGKKEIKDDLKKLLTFPSTDSEFTKQKETLADLLNFVTSIKNEKEISSSTYEQLIITGIELYKEIKEVEANPQNQEIRLNYLNIHQKLNGLISSKGKSGVLSTSLFNEIAKYDQRKILKTEVKEAGFNLKQVDEEKFLKLAQHKKHLINDEDHQKWLSFCYKECQTTKTAEKLETLVNDIVKLDLKDYWLNVNFLDAYEKGSDKALANLEQEYEQILEASTDILKASKLIDRMEHQIGQWAEPKNFKKLFEKELQPKIKEITNLIKLDEENKLSSSLAIKQLYRMVDAIDLSIKQLQNSPSYENKEQQVQNFKMMLGEFFQVMENQVGDLHPERILAMKNFFNEKSASNKPNELLPSSYFSVINAGFFQDNPVGFNRGFTGLPNKNLADLYTLVHQTSLGSIGASTNNINKNLMNRLPQFVKEIDKKLLEDRSKVFKDYDNSNSVQTLEKLSLLYMSYSYPHINLHYNIPLRNHSGNLILKYNVDKQSIELDYTMFGHSASIGNLKGRWERIEDHAFLLFEIFSDAKLTYHKSDYNDINLKIEITRDIKNIEEIVQILNTISDATNDFAIGSRYANTKLEKAFSNIDGDISKGANEFGLSKFILDAHKDSIGNIDSKNLYNVVRKLKNDSSKETRINLEKEALMRLMSMDNNGIINHKKLKEITQEFKDKQLSASELAEGDLSKLSIYAASILTTKLAMEKDYTNAMKAANLITSSGQKNFAIEKGFTDLSIVLIGKGKIKNALSIINSVENDDLLQIIASKFIEKNDFENGFKVIDKQSNDARDKFLSNLASKFIERDDLENAFRMIDRTTDGYALLTIAIKFIERDDPENALKVIDRTTDGFALSSVAIKFIERDDLENAFRLIDRTTDGYLSSVAIKFIERDDLENAFRLIDRTTDEYALSKIAIKFIERDKPESALKVIERITDGYALSKTAIKFIERDKPESALKVIDRITDRLYLQDFAYKFIDKGDFESSLKVADKITEAVDENTMDDYVLSSITNKFIEKDLPSEAITLISKIKNPTQEQLEYVKDNSPKKDSSSDWLSLPVAEAIEESSYRKVESDYMLTEAEKLEHLKNKETQHSAPMDYHSYIDQYPPQGKLPKVNTARKPNLPEDFKLPKTDMTVVGVIGARVAKFFVNKVTAGEKKRTNEKKAKQQNKNKGRIR